MASPQKDVTTTGAPVVSENGDIDDSPDTAAGSTRGRPSVNKTAFRSEYNICG